MESKVVKFQAVLGEVSRFQATGRTAHRSYGRQIMIPVFIATCHFVLFRGRWIQFTCIFLFILVLYFSPKLSVNFMFSEDCARTSILLHFQSAAASVTQCRKCNDTHIRVVYLII